MPRSPLRILVTGGGTGGHVIPALAVARELRERGHELLFVGSQRGLESKLAPESGLPVEWIEIGGLNRVGLKQTLRTLSLLPGSIWTVRDIVRSFRPNAVFSTGGFVAGPVMLAAAMLKVPIVIMEPNAVPGMTNRYMARFVSQALLNFEESAKYFPTGRSAVTGVPIRPEFLKLAAKPPSPGEFHVLITGGSRGSRTLNNAVRDSWPLFREAKTPIRMTLLTGAAMHSELAAAFELSGVIGEVIAFANNMAERIASADLLVCRSGAGALAELAAAGKPAILVPFPFASDQHQLRNAEALQKAGAGLVIADKEMTGRRLFDEVTRLAAQPTVLQGWSVAVRRFAYPEAATRAADAVERAGQRDRA